MRLLKFLVLYAGLALMSNPAAADVGRLMTLAEGDLAKIRFHLSPKQIETPDFQDAHGNPVSLQDYRGKYVLLNFWALWCAPCREEMPALDRLDASIGGNFEVVTVATGRNSKTAVDKFFVEKKLTNLPKLYDKGFALAQSLGVVGLPGTVFIGPDGQEVARVQGELVWDSPEAQTLIKAWMTGG